MMGEKLNTHSDFSLGSEKWQSGARRVSGGQSNGRKARAEDPLPCLFRSPMAPWKVSSIGERASHCSGSSVRFWVGPALEDL